MYDNLFFVSTMVNNWQEQNSGNTTVLTYFSGVTAENPSGNANLQTVELVNSNSDTWKSQAFEYDINDNLIKISNV